MIRKLGCAWICLSMTFVLTGCGPGIGDVSGLVKHQGQPVAGGTITFYDEYSGAASSEIKADGSYAVTRVATGTAKIAIVMPLAIQIPGGPVNKVTPIPDKYTDPELSGLRCKVVSGQQKHNIDLD